MSRIGEATDVVFVEIGGIVFTFDDRLSEKDERPREGRVLGRLPVFPDPLERLPGALNRRVVEQVMLGKFRHSCVADFARGGDPHELQHVLTGRPWLRVNQMSVPTFHGRELCQILVMTCEIVETRGAENTIRGKVVASPESGPW